MRPHACACPPVRPVVSAPACAHSRYSTCARCAPRGVCARSALPVPWVRWVPLRVACVFAVPARCACVFCRMLSMLCWLALFCLWLLWPTLACSRPPLCRAARSLRSSLLLAPRFSRGSVTIVCYNQSSALRGIAYNLAVWFNGPTLQRGTSRTAVGLTRYGAICTV